MVLLVINVMQNALHVIGEPPINVQNVILDFSLILNNMILLVQLHALVLNGEILLELFLCVVLVMQDVQLVLVLVLTNVEVVLMGITLMFKHVIFVILHV